MSTKIELMIAAGLPIAESTSNEEEGQFVFESLSPEQLKIFADIITGEYGKKTITTNSVVIIGDGIDEIELNVSGLPNEEVVIDIMTGSTPSLTTVVLDSSGKNSIKFSCETSPTKIIFSCGDSKCEVRAL